MIMTSPDLPSDARLEWIKEQYDCAQLFLGEASTSTDARDGFRRLKACVYFARSIVELMTAAAEKGEVQALLEHGKRKRRMLLRDEMQGILPYFELVYRARIHDFHRAAFAPDPERDEIRISGPIKFTAAPGESVVGVPGGQGLEITKGPESSVTADIPLTWHNDELLDETSREFVPLADVLREYLDAVPKAIARFEELRDGATTGPKREGDPAAP